MSTLIARRPLTAELLTALQACGKAVGDGNRPSADAGWIGQPNAAGSMFKPYLILTTLSAASSTGSFADPQSEWRIPYKVDAYGASREQCEWMADLARLQLATLRGQVFDLGTGRWKVQQIFSESIGGISRIDITDPPYWGQSDQFTAWLTKELS